MEKDLKWIKKHYGEKMMQLCREMFPKLLETEGVLSKILNDRFVSNRNLAEDIIKQNKQEEFKNYIFSFVDVEKETVELMEQKTAIKLLDEAGYILYPECKTEEDIQSFRHYYYRADGKTPVYNGQEPERRHGEEICTFNGGRLDTCRVWFAVKKNADQLKREDFKNPKRQDEYGTSVISIQFTRNDSTLSIKNRYNHTVNNPDNTFNSYLDNIVPGLTEAFYQDYGVKDNNNNYRKFSNFELDGYVCVDGKYYQYNYEINNVYYCPNNVIIDNFNVKKLPEHQILIDYFIFDIKNNEIKLYDDSFYDSFILSFNKIKNISFVDNVVKIKSENGEESIITTKNRKIISLTNESLTRSGHNFLLYNNALKELNLPNLKQCDDNFLYKNRDLKDLNLPNVTHCGNDFLAFNRLITKINLPNLTQCGNGFLTNANFLNKLNLPNLQQCGNDFLKRNKYLTELNLPNLQQCGNGFLPFNKSLTEINLPNLQLFESDFLNENNSSEKEEIIRRINNGNISL